VPLLLVPETYGPIILKKRAQKIRRETKDERVAAEVEMEKADLRHVVSVVLTRPIRMLLFERTCDLSSSHFLEDIEKKPPGTTS
jgi:hypothetical protein